MINIAADGKGENLRTLLREERLLANLAHVVFVFLGFASLALLQFSH